MNPCTSLLQWQPATTQPPRSTDVLAVSASEGTGPAILSHSGWTWADGHAITDLVAWAALPDGAQIVSEMRLAMQPSGAQAEASFMSHTRARIHSWVSDVLANRSVVQAIAETTQFVGRIRGLPSIAVTAESEAQATERLYGALVAHAERLLAAGHELPTWERPTPEVSPAMIALVRMSTLRRLLRERAGHWGAPRANLPAGACERLLADLDQLVTRHAMDMRGTLKSPKLNEKGDAA